MRASGDPATQRPSLFATASFVGVSIGKRTQRACGSISVREYGPSYAQSWRQAAGCASHSSSVPFW